MKARFCIPLRFILVGVLVWTLSIGCHTPVHLRSADYHRYEIVQDTQHTLLGLEISQLIEPYKAQLDAEMNMVIGTVPVPLYKDRVESTLGNWTADAIASYVEGATGKTVDLAICNYGGIRIPELPAGPLTTGKIYELMPFDNYIVTMNLKGSVLLRLLHRIADYRGWPVSGALRLEVVNERVAKAVLHGTPIQEDQEYFVALSDYLAEGGDQLDFLNDLPRTNLNVYYRDALIEVAKKQKEITADLEGRIKYLNQK